MKKTYENLKNTLFSIGILCMCFALCYILQNIFNDNTYTSAIFVLGVFLISVITPGYRYGIASALISVVGVNFAFNFPFFEFDLTLRENIVSTAILLVVTMITCGLTTEIKHHEALKIERDKEKMRANLLRAVSHDLRTPLTTIYSSSSALLESYDNFSDDQRKNMIKGISEDSKWLYRMVENLLSITKLDNGNVRIIKINTVLDELIDSVLVKFSKRYPEQHVEVDIPDEFISIPMDALLIEQVIINILENAVQHAKGMTRLNFRVFIKADKAIFEIKDNGCGIPVQKLKEIFNGIYTSSSYNADNRKNNAGIGLSVCASIIRAHGGDIKAENLKNGGCVFRFILNMEGGENA